MASPAPSDDCGGGGDDKPPESAPVDLTSLDSPADPQRNGESPAPSSGDGDMSAMRMTVIPDPERARCGAKRPLPSRPVPCRACARRKMILRGIDPGPPSDDELSASPSAPVPGMGTELPDPGALGTKWSPSAAGRCGPCEFRKKILLNRRLRRNSKVLAPPPGPPPMSFMPIPLLDDKSRLALEQKLRARTRRGKKRPLTVEQERGYRECDVGKKLMRHKWDGLHHKWAGLHRNSALEMPGFGAAAGGRDLLNMIGFGAAAGGRSLLEMPSLAAAVGGRHLLEMFGLATAAGGHDLLNMIGFDAAAGGRDLLEKMKALRADYAMLVPPQEAQKQSSSAAAGGLDLLEMPCFGAAAGGRDLLEMSGFGAASGGRDLLEMPCFGTAAGGRNQLEMPRFGAAAGGRNLLEMPDFRAAAGGDRLEMPGFCAMAGGRDLLEKMMLVMRKTLRVDYAQLLPPQGAQKHSSSAVARVDVLHEKLAQMTKVLTKILHEGGVLQVSTKLMRLLCPDVGSSTAAGGSLYGSDWGLVEEAIDNLVNQTGEGMQDIVKTVIPKVFSKEILYDLIMACVGRYPKLLEDDKGKLTKEKYEQYQKQLDLLVNLTTVYENDPENFSKIMKLMCKIGGCGPLPSEVIDDISPGLDPSTMEQLYTGMVELLHNVDRASPVHTNPSSK